MFLKNKTISKEDIKGKKPIATVQDFQMNFASKFEYNEEDKRLANRLIN